MPTSLKNVTDLALRRGFFWPAYLPYGGAAGLYVLGNLGVKLATNIANVWRGVFVTPFDFVEVDTPSLVPKPVLEASGHVSNFKDPMAECESCHRKYRADHLLADSGSKLGEGATLEQMQKELEELKVACPNCHSANWSVKPFLTMFETKLGPYTESVGYLRPETAQGTFVEFKRIFEQERERIPLGVAQIGRGFRNEISPRQGIIRLRELHMMELELFLDPEDPSCPYLKDVRDIRLRILTEKARLEGRKEPEEMSLGAAVENGNIKLEWLGFMMYLSQKFLTELGIPSSSVTFMEKLKEERAHYSTQTFDLEVDMGELGWVEVAGLAYRTDFDLKSHMNKTGVDFTVSVQLPERVKRRVKKWGVDVEKLKKLYPESWKEMMKDYGSMKEREGEPPASLARINVDPSVFAVKELEEVVNVRKFIPHVVEPAFGVERLMLAALLYAYSTKDDRTVLKFPRRLAPHDVAVFPLVSKEFMVRTSNEIAGELKGLGLSVYYDESGSVGRRYARADEIGVPFAVTVDGQTAEDGTVTLRDRDTWTQVRIPRGDVGREIIRRKSE